MKLYTSVAKGLKLKARKFWGLIPTFVEVTGEKLVGEAFLPPLQPPLLILNRVNRGALKSFGKFTGKQLCQSLFVNKVDGLKLATLLN